MLGLLSALGFLAGCASGTASPASLLRNAQTLRQACRSAKAAYPPRRPRVTIRKRDRVLLLSEGDQPLKEYRVALGGAPDGDKERQGDQRTPHGEFYVCTRLDQSKFHRFLGLSYPAPDDAARGLKAGLINAAQNRAIIAAHRRRVQPPWNTGLGGAVGIHGGGSSADWTLGCIAVENAEIEELFAVLPKGAPVRIEP